MKHHNYLRNGNQVQDGKESKEIILPIMKDTYGIENITIWWNRWRIFFMACAELFGFDDGNQWWVSHYLFGRND